MSYIFICIWDAGQEDVIDADGILSDGRHVRSGDRCADGALRRSAYYGAKYLEVCKCDEAVSDGDCETSGKIYAKGEESRSMKAQEEDTEPDPAKRLYHKGVKCHGKE